ncbi:hypothetical protein RI065_09705 [Mycoplasmatota bacterium zrk1]
MRLVINLLILTTILIVTGCSSKAETEELDFLTEKINDLEQNINSLEQNTTELDKPIDLLQILADNGWDCNIFVISTSPTHVCKKYQDDSETEMIIRYESIKIINERGNLHLNSPLFSRMVLHGTNLIYYIFDDSYSCLPHKGDCDEYIDEYEKEINDIKSSFRLILSDLDISIEDLIYFHRYYYFYMDNVSNLDWDY